MILWLRCQRALAAQPLSAHDVGRRTTWTKSPMEARAQLHNRYRRRSHKFMR